jgi:uncharacterized protein
MILKLLLIIGVISIVYFMFIKKKPENISKTKSDKKESKDADEMVECANCGVYAELDESFLSGSKYYCSKECLNAKR